MAWYSAWRDSCYCQRQYPARRCAEGVGAGSSPLLSWTRGHGPIGDFIEATALCCSLKVESSTPDRSEESFECILPRIELLPVIPRSRLITFLPFYAKSPLRSVFSSWLGAERGLLVSRHHPADSTLATGPSEIPLTEYSWRSLCPGGRRRASGWCTTGCANPRFTLRYEDVVELPACNGVK